MEKNKLKFKLIYRPFLLLLLGFISIYTLLNWVLCIRLSASLEDETIEVFLPAAISLLLVYFGIRPRIDFLIYRTSKSQLNYLFVFFFSLFIPVFIAQKSIVQLTGKMLEVQDITDINKDNSAKYYIIKDFSVDKRLVGYDIKIMETGGRRSISGKQISMKIFITSPIYSSDKQEEKSIVMYCKNYERNIDYNQSDEKRQKEYERFEKDALSQFIHNDNKTVSYFERVFNTNSDYSYLYNAAQMMGNESSEYIFLSAQTNPFDKRYYTWTLSFGISLLVVLIITWLMISYKELDMFKVESYINKK